MSHYWKKCPHCGRTIEDGYGLPTSSLGNPVKRCKFCHKAYTDRNVVDWETASIFRKFLFYFANGRIALCIFPYVLTSSLVGNKIGWDSRPYLYCLPVLLLSIALCVFYVQIRVRTFYGNEIDSKWFKVLSKICEFLSEYLAGLLGLAVIIFVVVLMFV